MAFRLSLARAAMLLAASGVALLAVGFAIDPLWPAQDPTPAMVRRHAADAAAADAVYRAGGGVLAAALAGALAAALRAVWRRRR